MKQTKRFRKALQGLRAMIVWVHEPAEDAVADGLSRQHLQDAAVVRMLDQGLKALGIGNVPEPPGNPWLNVYVNTLKFNGAYFYVVTLRLDEVVRPERNRDLKTVGTTWEASLAGAIPMEQMANAIEEAVDELLDYFIFDFLTENSH